MPCYFLAYAITPKGNIVAPSRPGATRTDGETKRKKRKKKKKLQELIKKFERERERETGIGGEKWKQRRRMR